MAQTSPALPHALYAHELILAQHGRAILCDITTQAIRRGVFRSVDALISTIEAYIAEHNREPKPFIRTAAASDILEKVKRAREVLDKVQDLR